MGTIMKRTKKDGSHRYTATIRKRQNGKVVMTLSETFASEKSANRWIKLRESELNTKGAVNKLIQSKKRKDWCAVIAKYCEASSKTFGKTKTANLAYLQRLDFGKVAIENTDDHTFFSLAKDLLKGVQAPPADTKRDCPEHYNLQPRLPQTVNSYMATLHTVVLYGGTVSDISMPISDFETAIRALSHQGMIGRSAKRNRRPTLEESDKLMSHFYDSYRADNRRVPMHKVYGAAITLSHRQEALSLIPWSDFNEDKARLILRNMKQSVTT